MFYVDLSTQISIPIKLVTITPEQLTKKPHLQTNMTDPFSRPVTTT